MEEIVQFVPKSRLVGKGAFKGSRQRADKCHREEQWCAQELARTWSQQGSAMRENAEGQLSSKSRPHSSS